MRTGLAHIETALLGQRGHLLPWVPIFLAIGIGGYFSLRFEPHPMVLIALGFAGAGLLVLHRLAGPTIGAFICCCGLVALGASVAGARAHLVAGPVLEWRYYGPVEGRIIGIDRSSSDAVRLTLDQVVLRKLSPAQTPHRVRISLHGQQGFIDPQPGLRVIATASLSPPQGPVEPRGFDFRRHAWFLSLGAVGYTRVPVLAIAESEGAQWFFEVRMALSDRVQMAVPGEAGAFAAAIMTGDRSGMSQETLMSLRKSNLAHLLAISGLHMGLLAGFVFASLRMSLILLPYVGLRWPVKKIAAFGALVAAAFYLGLSGGNIATQRAFIMVAVALGAVMADRRALSLRAVAIAAILILVWRPEALMSPGFQMSFAATTALVAVFGMLRDLEWAPGPMWARAVFAMILSSAVAGAATAPVGAAHFNQMAHYGLLANLASVPSMGIFIMPLAVLSVFLMPLGFEAPVLWAMGVGLEWILTVAVTVSNWTGAVGYVPSPNASVLPVFAFGALLVIIWQGRFRWVGVVPILVALVLWVTSERPQILVADSGALIGVLTQDGRALSKPKGAGFVARTWLENDGDGAIQETAAFRWPDQGKHKIQRMQLGRSDLIHVIGKTGLKSFTGCSKGDVVVLSVAAPNDFKQPCVVMDTASLRKTGALTLGVGPHGIQVLETAAQRQGKRLWNTPRAASRKRQYVRMRPTKRP